MVGAYHQQNAKEEGEIASDIDNYARDNGNEVARALLLVRRDERLSGVPEADKHQHEDGR